VKIIITIIVNHQKTGSNYLFEVIILVSSPINDQIVITNIKISNQVWVINLCN